MLRPTLAESRRREQRLNQPLVGIRSGIRFELHDRLRGRRQAEEVEVQPANQRAAVGLRRKRQIFALQFFGNEMIDRVGQVPGRLDSWNRRLAKRTPSPMVTIRSGDGRLNDGHRFLRLAKRQAQQQQADAAQEHHARMSVTTLPPTSVRRSSRPLWKMVRCSWLMPSKCRIVA